MSEKLAGILFLVASAVGGVVGQAMFHQMPPLVGYSVLAGCGAAFVLGCWLTLKSKKDPATSATPISHNVTSHNQQGGITAHTIKGNKDDV